MIEIKEGGYFPPLIEILENQVQSVLCQSLPEFSVDNPLSGVIEEDL